MRCYNCGNELANGTQFCTLCGADQSQVNQFSYQSQNNVQPAYSPALKLPTERGLLKFILLSLVTFGIYGVVTYSRIATEINIAASRYDGNRTMPFLGMCILAPVTLGVYFYVWMHCLSRRIGYELIRRGYNYKFGVSDFWLWDILGTLIIVGPYIYLYKLLKSVNMINASYNMYG